MSADFAEVLNQASWALIGRLGQASWQAAPAIIAAWGLSRLFQIPARVRCWIWRAAFAKLLLSLVWTGAIPLPVLPQSTQKADNSALAVRSVTFLAEEKLAQKEASIPLLRSASATPNQAPVPMAREHHFSPAAWLGLLWCAGFMVSLARMAAGWRCSLKLMNAGRPLMEGAVFALWRELGTVFGLRRAVGIRVSEEGPMVAGLFRPVILLPASVLQDAEARRLRLILGHELAHLKRGDLFWNVAIAAGSSLFFFHPLAWLVKREHRLAQEMACDALAIQVLEARPADYAAMLVEAATHFASPALLPGAAGIIESQQDLKKRVLSMKHAQAVSKRKRVRVMSAAMGLMMATAMPWKLVGQAPADPKSKTPQSLPKTEAASSLKSDQAALGRSKWTEEDVLRFRREFKAQLTELGEKLQNWTKAEMPNSQPVELSSGLRTTITSAKTATTNLVGAAHSLGQSTYRSLITMERVLEEIAYSLDHAQHSLSPSDLEANKDRINTLASFLPDLMPDIKAFTAKASVANPSSAPERPERTEEDLLRLQMGLRSRLENLKIMVHHWAEPETPTENPQTAKLLPQLITTVASVKIAALQLNEATKPVVQFTFNVIDDKLKELTQILEKVQEANAPSHPLSASDWNNYKNRADTLGNDLAGLMPDVEAVVAKASIPLTKTIVIQVTADGRLTYYGETKTIPWIGALLRNTKTHRPNINVRIQGDSFQAVQSDLAIALAEECLRAGVRDVFAMADYTTGRFRVVPEKIDTPISPYRTPVSISENGIYSIEGQDMVGLAGIEYYLKTMVEAHPDGVALAVNSPNTPKANQAVQDLEHWCQNTPIVSMSVQLVSTRK